MCISCRAAVAEGLFRIEWVDPFLYDAERFGLPTERYRVLFFATSAEHPLGVEWPHRIGPKLYDPRTVRARWRQIDRDRAELANAQTALNQLTQWG